MPQHIQAPARGKHQPMSYCGQPVQGTPDPKVGRETAVLAALVGQLDLYCRSCVAAVMATSFRSVEAGSKGASVAQERRTVQERRQLGAKAANARWSRQRGPTGILGAGT
jgi:hypothetical protein